MSDSTSLVLSEATAIEIYSPSGMRGILDQIAAEVSGMVPDLSTAKGRKAIASMAAKVARSKTHLDSLGKELTADIDAQRAIILTDRREMRNELDELRDEVRRPLTEWEDAEKLRVSVIQQRITSFGEFNEGDPATSGDWKQRIDWLESVEINDSFSEFAADAAKAKDHALAMARAELITAESEERDEVERQAEQAMQQDAREKRIADEAAATATRETEDAAAREADRVKLDAVAKCQQIEQERLDAERREHEAEARAKRAEANAQQRADDSAARAKHQAQQAEQQRAHEAQAEQQRIVDANAARAANIEHQRGINRVALAGFIATGLSQDQSVKTLTAIIRGEIPHVEIKY